MKFNLPDNVKKILEILHSNGHAAYVVGGCVRDILLGVHPKDWDICTSSLPEETQKLFKDYQTIETGLKHGTLTVVIDNVPYEITTFRIDGDYKDNRHPETVEFVSDLALDLARRDFTINSMAYNDEEGLIDYYNGYVDLLSNKQIKCVGDPNQRFQEDALRIMRALRFSSILGFSIEEKTLNAMYTNITLLKNIAKERISTELIGTLMGRWIGDFNNELQNLLIKCVRIATNENIQWHNKTFEGIGFTISLPLKLAILFYKDTDGRILHSLRFSKDIINKVIEIHKIDNMFLLYLIESGEKEVKYQARWLLSKLKFSNFSDIIGYFYWKEKCYNDEPNYRYIINLDNALRECIRNNDPVKISDLDINGNDLLESGIEKTLIGFCLEQLLNKVMLDEVSNKKEDLLNYVKTAVLWN